MKFQRADAIYELLTGERVPGPDDPAVENLFAEGELCEALYNDVYEANLRLCERLKVQEDQDVEIIINNLLRISKLLGRRMFYYGTKFTPD